MMDCLMWNSLVKSIVQFGLAAIVQFGLVADDCGLMTGPMTVEGHSPNRTSNQV